MAVTRRRKLLTAAVGVATVSYVVACGGLDKGGGETSGNLVAAGGTYGYGGAETSGNLAAPPPPGGAGGYSGGETSGNLVAPPPPQGGSGGSAGTATIDAGASDAAVSSGNEGDAAAEPDDAAVDSGP
jgi:hypothetical protein